MPPEPKTCKSCQADFTPTHKAHIFCTVPCRREYQKRELPSLTRQFGLTTGTVGALNELRVCVDLMQRGYHVFRSMSPSCPCDLMAWAPDGKMLAVEVKTGYELGNHISAVSTRNNTFDVLAVVLTERIVYTPALETLAISA